MCVCVCVCTAHPLPADLFPTFGLRCSQQSLYFFLLPFTLYPLAIPVYQRQQQKE